MAHDWRAFEAVVVSRCFCVRNAGNRVDQLNATGTGLLWLSRFRSEDYYNAAVQPVRYRTVLTAQATLVAFTLEGHVPKCRGPSVDRPAVLLRVWVAIGDAPLDHPFAGNGGEPRNDLRVLAKSLLNAKQNRAVELPPLWLWVVWVE